MAKSAQPNTTDRIEDRLQVLQKELLKTNRYTFVWRGSINYHLAGLLDSIDQLFEKYNAFLQENDYGSKYELGNAQMQLLCA